VSLLHTTAALYGTLTTRLKRTNLILRCTLLGATARPVAGHPELVQVECCGEVPSEGEAVDAVLLPEDEPQAVWGEHAEEGLQCVDRLTHHILQRILTHRTLRLILIHRALRRMLSQSL